MTNFYHTKFMQSLLLDAKNGGKSVLVHVKY